jgi:hypothetical protein
LPSQQDSRTYGAPNGPETSCSWGPPNFIRDSVALGLQCLVKERQDEGVKRGGPFEVRQMGGVSDRVAPGVWNAGDENVRLNVHEPHIELAD